MAPRRRRVVWTAQAREALTEALEHLAEESRAAAERLLTDCLAAAASLSELSQRGHRIEEATETEIRQLIVQRFRLLYEVTDAEVHILALLHGARDFAAWRRQGGLDALNEQGHR